jgi:hypothetical protein
VSAKPETTFIGGVHKRLPEAVYRMKNNNPFLGGLPDCWYSGSKDDLWIEYKFFALPKRDDTLVDLVSGKNPHLSKLQQEWLKARACEGRNVGVIVGTPEGGAWFPNLAWDCAYTARSYRASLRSKQALADLIASLVLQ